MSFTSSLNYTQTLTQEASGSLTLLGSGSTGRTDVFTVNGNNGTLFSVSDDLSNSLFSVNTIAGLPVIEAFANNSVVMGQYGQNVLVINGTNVGIGTATPQAKLSVTGTSGAFNDVGIFQITSGTGAYANLKLTFGVNDSGYTWIQSVLPGTDIRPLLINPAGGNIGINNTSPTEILDVRGTIRVSRSGVNDSGILAFGNFLSGTGYYDNGIFRGALNAPTTAGNILHIASYEALAFTTSANAFGSQAIRMYIDGSSGNVGIGTTSPSARLDIRSAASSGATNAPTFRAFGLDTDSYFEVNNNANNSADIKLTRSDGATMFKIDGHTGVTYFAGDVGVGTTSPSALLSGTERVIEISNSNVASLYLDSTSGRRWSVSSISDGSMTFWDIDAVAERMRIDTSGNLGIKNNNPSARIDTNGSIASNSGLTNTSSRPAVNTGTLTNGEFRAYSSTGIGADDGFLRVSAGGGTNTTTKSYIDISGFSTVSDMDRNIVLGTSGTERMRITNGGNVGIGTTNPAVPLDVNGSANVKGGITGQDSSGNYRYEFAPELAYTRVGVGGVGTYKINSGAVSTTSMLRIKSTSTSGWLSSQANYFNGTVISDGLCDVAISTVGTLLFLNSNGEWGIADADIAAKSVTLLGIALNSTSGVGETVDVLIDGIIALKSNHDQISIPASPGAPLYVSTNAGNVTEVAPSGTGDIVRLVGHNVWSATSPQNTAIIRFQPDNTWIEL
jgi:hypothetical protein